MTALADFIVPTKALSIDHTFLVLSFIFFLILLIIVGIMGKGGEGIKMTIFLLFTIIYRKIKKNIKTILPQP